jgi:GAF domain-containing protein
VLDREDERFSLAEMDLLGLFANQAAIALDLLARARRAKALLDGGGTAAVVARLAALVDERVLSERAGSVRFLEALEALLRAEG